MTTGTIAVVLCEVDCAVWDRINSHAWTQANEADRIEQYLQAHHRLALITSCRFLSALALCNTVTPCETEFGSIQYNASNPDDGALVEAAANLGVALWKRVWAAPALLLPSC